MPKNEYLKHVTRAVLRKWQQRKPSIIKVMKAHFYIVSYTVNKNLKTCWENDPTKTERQLQNPKSSNTIPYMTNNQVKWTLAFLVKYCVITNINMYIPIHIATRATCHPWIKILV